jgi:hypothetical protein
MIRWLAFVGLLGLALSSGVRADMYPDGSNATWDVRSYGANVTGGSDATAALNACLTKNQGATCYAYGVLKLLGTVTIPPNTTLKCGDNIPDQEDTPASYGTAPRLMLDSAHQITTSGQGAKLTGCLIVRNGMTFPAADSTLYAGIAVSDGGHSNFQVSNDVIIGFDTCVDVSGGRPWVNSVYVDCNGSTHPAVWAHNGNTDSGYFNWIKLQPLGTGNYNGGAVSCAGATRPGTGFEADGINFYDNIVSQNFRVTQYKNTIYMIAGKLWADFPPACQSTYSSSIGFINAGQMTVDELNLNGTGSGLSITGNASIRHLFVNSIGGDCVLTSVGGAPNLAIFDYDTNIGTGICGNAGSGHAVNFSNGANTLSLTISSGTIHGVASTPYISLPATSPAYAINVSEKLITDLADPSSIFGVNSISQCTGAGATASCGFRVTTLTTPYKGIILINAAGTPTATGIVKLNMPEAISIGGAGGAGCIASLSGDSGAWNVGSTLNMGGVSPGNPIIEEFDWSNNGVALTAGKTYAINYHCDPQ